MMRSAAYVVADADARCAIILMRDARCYFSLFHAERDDADAYAPMPALFFIWRAMFYDAITRDISMLLRRHARKILIARQRYDMRLC